LLNCGKSVDILTELLDIIFTYCLKLSFDSDYFATQTLYISQHRFNLCLKGKRIVCGAMVVDDLSTGIDEELSEVPGDLWEIGALA